MILGAALALGLIMPAAASAMVVTQSSSRPNGFFGQDTYGKIPTRLTWQGQIRDGDPAVTALELKLPAGTDLKSAKVAVITLTGLTRNPVPTTPQINGETISMQFAPSLEATTNVRVTVENVVFPTSGGTFEVEAAAQSATGTVNVTSQAAPMVVKPMTLPEQLIFWLNQQAWVTAWNSVPILNMFFKPQIIVASLAVEFKGWLLSLALVLLGFPVSIPIALALAFAKMSKLWPIRWIASFYVNVVRGTPLFLQIYIAFFGLPLLGVNPNKILLGVIVLALNSSAYLTEIFRAGIQSIAKGQFEAASSLGMTYPQAMQYVIIPQTVKRVLPTMTSEFILLYKDTALLSAVGVFELMMYSKNLAAISGNVTPYIVAAFFYLIVTTPLIRTVQTLEYRLAIAEGGQAASDTKPKKGDTAPVDAEPGLSVQDGG